MARNTQTERRFSVCIGVNTYAGGLSSLNYAEADAVAIDALLGERGFPQEQRRLLLGEGATYKTINAALEEIILDAAQTNDLVVVFFAGHGVPLAITNDETSESEVEVFLAAHDFDRTVIQSRLFRRKQALGMQRLRREFFEGDGSRKRLFIFDSCYSGEFPGVGYRDADDLANSTIKQALATTTATGRVALASCLPTQKAQEDPTLGHGLMTYHILQALRGEAIAAQRRNGVITVNSLFDYLSETLPTGQRPVLTCTQHESFELVRFEVVPSEQSIPESHGSQREQIFRQHLHDHASFIQDRINSFVGREQELAEIRQRIAEKLPTGGYVTITGQAGQGKSSVIARQVVDALRDATHNAIATITELIAIESVQAVAFHFIPFSPGPDHQVGLMHNLIARLCLMHDLPESYVATDSRPALRDYFAGVLREIHKRGRQEVIYIDGLDQIEEDLNGQRDLSFLPINPPEGIVFVLGTRPNDTLKPLEILKPQSEYQLPPLSRADFGRILEQREVALTATLADRFYAAMQQNALYLDLAARELHEVNGLTPEQIIRRVADNPQNLFGIAIERFKRDRQEWRTVLKPILGLLLTTQAPLSIRALRTLIQAESDAISDGVQRLGGLLTVTGDRRYALFHLKLRDFLVEGASSEQAARPFTTDDVENYHQRLADWCEHGRGGLDTIWVVASDALEDERRIYARSHYIAHLAAARSYQRLWAVVDQGHYGRAKLQYDPGTQSYALDLDISRQAVIDAGLTFDEQVALLPQLWRYSLLRCNLNSRADRYPDSLYETMIRLGKEQEALGFIELISNPARKIRLLVLSNQILQRTEVTQSLGQRFLERAQDLFRANITHHNKLSIEQLFSTMPKDESVSVNFAILETVILPWVQANNVGSVDAHPHTLAMLFSKLVEYYWIHRLDHQQANILISQWQCIPLASYSPPLQDQILSQLILALTRVGQYNEARTAANAIAEPVTRYSAFCTLAHALDQAESISEAQQVLRVARTTIDAIKDEGKRGDALSNLAITLAQTGRHAEARTTIDAIKDEGKRGDALSNLATALSQAGYPLEAQQVLRVARTTIDAIKDEGKRGDAFSNLATALSQAGYPLEAQQVLRVARTTIDAIKDEGKRGDALSNLAITLAQTGKYAEARTTIYIITNENKRGDALSNLATALIQARQYTEARTTIDVIENAGKRGDALSNLATALIQARQYTEARTTIDVIKDEGKRGDALSNLATALIQAGQYTEARTTIDSITNASTRWSVLRHLAVTLIQVGHIEEVQKVFEIARITISAITNASMHGDALSDLAALLAQTGQMMEAQQLFEAARTTIDVIAGASKRVDAFRVLAISMAQAGQMMEAQQLFEAARTTTDIIADASVRWRTLCDLAVALAQTGYRVEAQQVFETARTTIDSIIGGAPRGDALAVGAPRGDALSGLVAALIQAEQYAEGRATIDAIVNESRRGELLCTLATALIQAEQYAEGRATIDAIVNESRRGELLCTLATALIRTEQYAEGRATIDAIVNESRRGELLCTLATALGHAGQYAEARATIEAITNGDKRGYALRELAVALTRAELYAEARDTIDAIVDNLRNGYALRDLAIALAQAGQYAEARDTIGAIMDEGRRGEALSALATALAQAGQMMEAQQVFEVARTIINAIVDDYWRWYAQRALAIALTQAGQYVDARVAIDAIANVSIYWRALCDLAVALAQNGYRVEAQQVFETARTIIDLISGGAQRGEALSGLAAALTQVEQYAEARATIDAIVNERAREQALRTLAIVLTQVEQYAEARATIDAIVNESRRREVLRGLATELAQSGHYTITDAIMDNRMRGDPLRNLTWALAKANRWPSLVQLVQSIWQMTTTQEDLLSYLAIGHPLLIRDALLMKEVLDAFTWIDAFVAAKQADR